MGLRGKWAAKSLVSRGSRRAVSAAGDLAIGNVEAAVLG